METHGIIEEETHNQPTVRRKAELGGVGASAELGGVPEWNMKPKLDGSINQTQPNQLLENHETLLVHETQEPTTRGA